jgi:amidase
MGLPGLTVTTNVVGNVPIGVQLVAAHFREDLCLQAGADIEARGAPILPVDPDNPQ